MPFVNIAGLSKEKVCEISNDLINLLSEESGTSKEKIRIFYNPLLEIVDGKENNKKLSISIQWLSRPMELRQKVAERYFIYFEEMGYKNTRIYFEDINKDYYFTR